MSRMLHSVRTVVATIAALLAVISPVLADARFDRVKAAFEQWADANRIKSASLVLVFNGTVVGSASRGKYDAAMPVPIASDSKLITGLCIVRAVDAGLLGFSSTLGDLLPAVAKAAKDRRVAGISVAQLLTHSSGISFDASQGATLGQFAPFSKASAPAQVKATLAHKLGQAPGAGYAYNNMNYALLDLIIAAVTGEDYATWCGRTVLEPVGITDATLNPNWRSMGAYGGWLISANDYARLFSYFAPDSTLLATPAAKWPRFPLGNGVSYGIGTLVRVGASWFNFWHFGSWAWSSGKVKASFGSYFANWGGGLGVFAAYTPTISDDQMNALDAAVSAAALQ